MNNIIMLDIEKVKSMPMDIVRNIRIDTNLSSIYDQIERKVLIEDGKSGIIDELYISLIKGYPIPPIYVSRNKDNTLTVINGNKIVRSINSFYKSNMYSNFDEATKRVIDYDTSISIVEISVQGKNKEEVLKYIKGVL